MIPPILTVCLSCSFLVYSSLAAPQPDPQRVRPVALASPASQGGAIYSQQLTFGPQQPSPSTPPQPQPGRLRISQNQPIVLQQSSLSAAGATQAKPAQFAQFPGVQQIASRQQPIAAAPVAATVSEDEYDDEEYEEDPKQQLQASPSPRPVPQQSLQQQRGQQIRVTPQPQSILQLQPQLQTGPGPQRFIVPQQQAQPQPTPQQIRRPSVQQRVVPQVQPQPQQQQLLQQPQLQQYQTRQPSQQVQQIRQNTPGQDSRLKNRVSTPPPIQTIDRYMRNNPDGSITWGYVNEDGTFKEETLGADCVVKGKYGYIDPDGTKREYEYQQGNPCDPNKRGQEEEEDVLSPNSQQKLGGILTARPGQQQRPRPIQQQIYQQ